jgi:molecular chaperone DnaK
VARDAESHAAEDRRRRDEVEARNRADAMVYNVEKMLKEHRSKISDAEAREIESALEECKRSIKDGTVERINTATDKLTRASHKLAEAMYRAAGPQPGGPEPPPESGSREKPKDNVVDAEFVDVDDKKK